MLGVQQGRQVWLVESDLIVNLDTLVMPAGQSNCCHGWWQAQWCLRSQVEEAASFEDFGVVFACISFLFHFECCKDSQLVFISSDIIVFKPSHLAMTWVLGVEAHLGPFDGLPFLCGRKGKLAACFLVN